MGFSQSMMNQSKDNEAVNLQYQQLSELRRISESMQQQQLSTSTNNAMNRVTSQPVGGVVTQTALGGDMLTATMATMGLVAGSIKDVASGVGTAASTAVDGVGGFVESLKSNPFTANVMYDNDRLSLQQQQYNKLQKDQRLGNIMGGLGKFGIETLSGHALGTLGMAVGNVPGAIAGELIGSTVGSVVGEGIVGGIKNYHGYQNYLAANADKIFTSMKSTNGRGTGLTNDQIKGLSKDLLKMNTGLELTNDEMFTMLNNVTEAGLLNSAQDMQDFKKKFSTLAKTVKEGAGLLNTSYEEMAQMMGDLNRMGIKDPLAMRRTLEEIDKTGMATGKGSVAAAQAMQAQYDNAYAGTNVAGAVGMKVQGDQLEVANYIKEKASKMDGTTELNNYIGNNLGGSAEELAKHVTNVTGEIFGKDLGKMLLTYAADQTEAGGITFNSERMADAQALIRDGKIAELAQMSAERAAMPGSEMIATKISSMNANSIRGQLESSIGMPGTASLTADLINGMAKDRTDKSGMKVDGVQVMTDTFGIDTEQAVAMLQYFNKAQEYAPVVTEVSDQAGFQKRALQKNLKQNRSIFEKISDWGENLGEDIGVPTFNKTVEDGWDRVVGDNFKRMKMLFSGSNMAQEEGLSEQKETTDIFKDLMELDSVKTAVKKDGSIMKSNRMVRGPWAMRKGSEITIDNLTGFQREKNNSISYQGGENIKDMEKRIRKSKDLTEEEQTNIISDLEEYKNQSKNIMEGSMTLVGMFGNADLRDKFIKKVKLDTSVKQITGAKNIGELATNAKMNKLSTNTMSEARTITLDEMRKFFASDLGMGNTDVGRKKLMDAIGENIQPGEMTKKLREITKDKNLTKEEYSDALNELVKAVTSAEAKNKLKDKEDAESGKKSDSEKKSDDSVKTFDKSVEKYSEVMDKYSKKINEKVKDMEERVSDLESSKVKKFF